MTVVGLFFFGFSFRYLLVQFFDVNLRTRACEITHIIHRSWMNFCMETNPSIDQINLSQTAPNERIWFTFGQIWSITDGFYFEVKIIFSRNHFAFRNESLNTMCVCVCMNSFHMFFFYGFRSIHISHSMNRKIKHPFTKENHEITNQISNTQQRQKPVCQMFDFGFFSLRFLFQYIIWFTRSGHTFRINKHITNYK